MHTTPLHLKKTTNSLSKACLSSCVSILHVCDLVDELLLIEAQWFLLPEILNQGSFSLY